MDKAVIAVVTLALEKVIVAGLFDSLESRSTVSPSSVTPLAFTLVARMVTVSPFTGTPAGLQLPGAAQPAPPAPAERLSAMILSPAMCALIEAGDTDPHEGDAGPRPRRHERV